MIINIGQHWWTIIFSYLVDHWGKKQWLSINFSTNRCIEPILAAWGKRVHCWQKCSELHVFLQLLPGSCRRWSECSSKNPWKKRRKVQKRFQNKGVGTYKECYKGNANCPSDFASLVQALTRFTIVVLGWSSTNSFFFQKAGSVQNGHVGQRTFTLQEPRNHGITQVPVGVQCEMVILGDYHCHKTGFPNSRSAEGQLFREKAVDTSHGCPSATMAIAVTWHTPVPGPSPIVRKKATSPITISRPTSSSPSSAERSVASTILRSEFLQSQE